MNLNNNNGNNDNGSVAFQTEKNIKTVSKKEIANTIGTSIENIDIVLLSFDIDDPEAITEVDKEIADKIIQSAFFAAEKKQKSLSSAKDPVKNQQHKLENTALTEESGSQKTDIEQRSSDVYAAAEVLMQVEFATEAVLGFKKALIRKSAELAAYQQLSELQTEDAVKQYEKTVEISIEEYLESIGIKPSKKQNEQSIEKTVEIQKKMETTMKLKPFQIRS